jgi:hypothetical protein
MNQNIFGAFLFSIIIGSAVLVSLYLTPLPKPLPVYEAPVYAQTGKTLTCNKSRVEKHSPPVGSVVVKIRQAVLNQTTHKLTTEYLVKRDHPQTEAVRISLHFFAKDGRSTQYLASESITLEPVFDQNGMATENILSSFKWLDDLKQTDNLYVTIDLSANFNRSKNLEPVFNPAAAIPVLKN